MKGRTNFLEAAVRELLASIPMPPDPDPDDAFSYWTFKDLQARRIVASRTDLHRKQRYFGFPRPVIFTGGRGANAMYRVIEVKSWLTERERLATQNTAPGNESRQPSAWKAAKGFGKQEAVTFSGRNGLGEDARRQLTIARLIQPIRASAKTASPTR